MPEPIIVALIMVVGGIIGGIIGSLITYFLNRNKQKAEIDKIRAETKRTELETTRLIKGEDNKEFKIDKTPLSINIFSTTLDNDLYDRVKQLMKDYDKDNILEKENEELFTFSEISERILYLIRSRREIELKIRELLLEKGGGWAGCSMASTDTYIEYLQNSGILDKDSLQKIYDFYFFSNVFVYGNDIDDDSYLTALYMVRELINLLERLRSEHKSSTVED